jgi:hypothetical protein
VTSSIPTPEDFAADFRATVKAVLPGAVIVDNGPMVQVFWECPMRHTKMAWMHATPSTAEGAVWRPALAAFDREMRREAGRLRAEAERIEGALTAPRMWWSR